MGAGVNYRGRGVGIVGAFCLYCFWWSFLTQKIISLSRRRHVCAPLGERHDRGRDPHPLVEGWERAGTPLLTERAEILGELYPLPFLLQSVLNVSFYDLAEPPEARARSLGEFCDGEGACPPPFSGKGTSAGASHCRRGAKVLVSYALFLLLFELTDPHLRKIEPPQACVRAFGWAKRWGEGDPTPFCGRKAWVGVPPLARGGEMGARGFCSGRGWVAPYPLLFSHR